VLLGEGPKWSRSPSENQEKGARRLAEPFKKETLEAGSGTLEQEKEKRPTKLKGGTERSWDEKKLDHQKENMGLPL